MITFVDGEIESKHPTSVILNVGGIGYEVLIPLSSYDRLPSKGERCRILTVDYVREDQHSLFGFMTEEERRLFGQLLGISGIGPKLALSALSGLSVRELVLAVSEGDTKRLSSISGVGKKMAERMVVELRDKLSEADQLEAAATLTEIPEGDMISRDAAMALVALGYSDADAHKMVQKVIGEPGLDTVEAIIRKALAR